MNKIHDVMGEFRRYTFDKYNIGEPHNVQMILPGSLVHYLFTSA